MWFKFKKENENWQDIIGKTIDIADCTWNLNTSMPIIPFGYKLSKFSKDSALLASYNERINSPNGGSYSSKQSISKTSPDNRREDSSSTNTDFLTQETLDLLS